MDNLGQLSTSSEKALNVRLYERLEALMAGQGEVLEMISRGAPLTEILTRIIDWVQAQSSDGAIASILLTDDEGTHLLHGAAPGLPAEYNKAIHGIRIGVGVGSCGTAAHTKTTVIVEDIENDVLWKDFKGLALAHGLKACWSIPLLSKDGRVQGTFAIYYREPRTPAADDLHVLKLVSKTVVLAIEHIQAEKERKELRDAEQKSLERIEAERKRLHQLFMNAPAMIAVLRGPEHIYELANSVYMKAIGANREVINKPIAQALPELANQGIFELLDSVYSSGKPYLGKEVFIQLDYNGTGKLDDCYFDFTYEPLRDEHGNVDGIFVHAVDVTDFVKARKKVEESEQRFKSFVYASPSPIGIYVGREMRIHIFNDAILTAWGKKKEQVVGKTFHEVLPELADQPFFKILDDVYTTGIPYHAQEDKVNLVRDGKLVTTYFNFTYSPLLDERGNVYGVMNTATEVTDLVLARQKLAEAEESLRTALEVADMAAWRVDLRTGIAVFSKRFQDWFGLETNSGDISVLIHFVHPDDQPHVQAAINKARSGSGYYDAQYRIVKNGNTRHLHSRGKVYSDDEGRPLYMTGTTRDVTLEKVMQEELAKQVEERTLELKKRHADLQKLNDNLQQFVYVSSHDLQEPLRKINIFTDLILKKHRAGLSEPAQSYMDKISQSALRMSGLLSDLLDFSRVGARNDEFVPTDLNQVLGKIIIDYELMVQQKNASIISHQLCTIEAVPIHMNQLFYNLIGNALKYSKANVPPTISVSCRKVEDIELARYETLDPGLEYCHLVISDNGIGFEQDYAEQIFVIFQRLHRRDQYEGTGIGLALCKKITDYHNGIIFAEGRGGEGASFHIILPIKRK